MPQNTQRRQQPVNPRPLAAISYAKRGLRVFPLQPDQKAPLGGTHGFYDATTDEAAIKAFWQRWPRANVGIRTGDGLILIDEDTYKGADTTAWMLPVTYTVRTARGGLHRYFTYDGPLPCVPEGKLALGVCIKADGGYVVAPPSTFQGKPYVSLDEAQPLVQLPERIAQMIREAAQEEKSDAPIPSRPASAISRGSTGEYWVDKAVEQARGRGRNNAGFWLAQQLVWNECDDPEGAMRYYARLVEDWDRPFYTEREALASLTQARKPPDRVKGEPARSQKPSTRGALALVAQPMTRGALALADATDDPPDPPGDATDDAAPHCTDMGNARRFVTRYGEDARYVATWNQWLVWDGKRWRRDGTGEAARLAKQTVRGIYAEAADAEDDSRRKDLVKWAMKSEADSRIKAMLSQGQTEPEIAVDADAFDAQPWLFSVANGTIDLRTGMLLPHDRGHRITRMSRVIYDAKAQCPTWLAFLSRIMAGNERVMTFLQRAVGYSLTDDTTEQVLFLLHGGGQNGKSKLLEAIEGIVGDYGMQTPTTTLMAKRDNSIPNDVARLKGARFVKAIETEEGHSLAESLVKQMTGGDMLSARFMRGEWFDFRPTFKLWLAANHLPTIRGSDDGIWRRIRYIPFSVQIPENERDAALGDKLRAEYPGILAWAVRGCLDWQREGLGYPDEIREATRQYREQMDHFGRFVGDCCVLDKKCQIGAKALRMSYEQWCEDNGERPRSQTWIGRELQRLGMLRSKDSGGLTLYSGIGLRSQQP